MIWVLSFVCFQCMVFGLMLWGRGRSGGLRAAGFFLLVVGVLSDIALVFRV
ncbi:hypothetical protein ACFV1C_00215 [Streptomyces sp. NPDC059605]|uniref:hypothetical protein n=1 Tax=Streptomyces sp. NPDC059605 TaxID=3346882 RepID=UPI00367D9248